MGITCQLHNSRSTLHFDEQSKTRLLEQVSKDEASQRLIRITIIVLAIILVAGGATTCGLGFAVIIPYGLLHTCAAAAGAGSFALGSMGLAAFSDSDNDLLAVVTKRPHYCHLKSQLNSANPVIWCEKSWTYLNQVHADNLRYFQLFKTKAREALDEQLSLNDPIYTYSLPLSITADYL